VATPSASTQYFAWDLSEFKNGLAIINSVAVGVVPEPTTVGLAMLGAAGLLLRRRTR